MDPRQELERRLRALEERRPDWYALRFSQGRVYLALQDKVAELPFRRLGFLELVNDLDEYGDFLVPDVNLLRLVAESYGRNLPVYEPTQRLLALKERAAARENENVLELLRRLLSGMRADAQEDDFPTVDILDPSLLLIATKKAEPALAAELLVAGVDPAKPFLLDDGVETTALKDLEYEMRYNYRADRERLAHMEELYTRAAERLRGAGTKSAHKTSAKYLYRALEHARGDHAAAARMLYFL